METDVGFAVSFASDPVLQGVVDQLQRHMNAGPLEWHHPGDWHLSLVYAAEPQPQSVISRLIDCAAWLAHLPAFTVPLTRYAIWETATGDKGLVVIGEMVPPLVDVQRRLVRLLEAQGIPLNLWTRPDMWWPHVSLALSFPGEAPPWPAGGALTVDNVCLTTPTAVLRRWDLPGAAGDGQ